MYMIMFFRSESWWRELCLFLTYASLWPMHGCVGENQLRQAVEAGSLTVQARKKAERERQAQVEEETQTRIEEGLDSNESVFQIIKRVRVPGGERDFFELPLATKVYIICNYCMYVCMLAIHNMYKLCVIGMFIKAVL